MKSRTDAKRDAILAVATKAFLELGYEGTSMAEISERVGGSKATLYGYFPSKEGLFHAVTRSIADEFIGPAMSELTASSTDDPEAVLQRLGEATLSFICSPVALAAHRMVMAEAGRSDVGRRFYESGPRHGVETVASYFRALMEHGKLRAGDPTVAAKQFLALLNAETQILLYYRDKPKPTRRQIATFVERAVEVFMGGCGGRAHARRELDRTT